MSRHPDELREIVYKEFELATTKSRASMRNWPGSFAVALYHVLLTRPRARKSCGRTFDMLVDINARVDYEMKSPDGNRIVSRRTLTWEERDALARQFVAMWDRDVRKARRFRPKGPLPPFHEEKPKPYVRRYLSPTGMKSRIYFKGWASKSARRNYNRTIGEEDTAT